MKDFQYIIIVLTGYMLCCGASQYWVRPNTTVDCPMGVPTQQCVTITDIAANNSKYFTSNTVIRFMAGEHTVTEGYSDGGIGVLSVVRLQYNDISLIGEKDTSIKCERHNFGLVFKNVRNLSISRVAMCECGISHHLDGKHTPFSTIHSSLLLESIETLLLEDVLITRSIGFGLLGIKLKKNIRIDSCIFSNNNRIPGYSNINGTQEIVYGGNAYLEIQAYRSSWNHKYYYNYYTNITVSNSLFINGLFCYQMGTQHEGCSLTPRTNDYWSAGLHIYMIQTSKANSIISLNNCTFYNNIAIQGANMLIRWHTDMFSDRKVILMVTNCTIDNGKSVEIGGGVYVDLIDNSKSSQTTVNIIFTNSTFTNNTAERKGGAVAIKALLDVAQLNISIQGSKFIENSAKYGGAILTQVETRKDRVKSHVITIINNDFISNRASQYGGAIFFENIKHKTIRNYHIEQCNFIGNTAGVGSALSAHYIQQKDQKDIHQIKVVNSVFTEHNGIAGYDSKNCSVIHLHNIYTLYIENISIIDNSCRGIHVNMSTIRVGNEVWIVNNTATQGAGLLLDCHPFCTEDIMSRMIFTDMTSLYIQNNNAQSYGGGIAVGSECMNSIMCFFEPSGNNVVYMSDNKAGIAGTSIYGGYLEHCNINMKTQLTPDIFWKTFNITDTRLPSVVTSRPNKVCICKESFTTDRSCLFEYGIEVYPGAVFHIPAVGLGHYNYSSPSVIRAKVVNGQHAELAEHQYTQVVNLLCKNLKYSLQTLEKSVTIELSIETPLDSVLRQLQPAILTLTILDCPIGFELHKDSHTCECLHHLKQRDSEITCNILDQTVHKSKTMWIGNFSGDIVVHHNCPYDYCDKNVTDFRLDNQQKQCDLNRAGILCGACQSGYSLVLGTSKCKECTNVYLLLLMPFLLAGFGLVVLLLKCNLTVSMGTINGLIFYANIIQVNNKVFSQTENTYAPINYCNYLLSIFIAWINLDFGIEVCFSESLNTFIRTWLQFLFPIYIWLIVGLLILVCRYSTTVSRLTGYNTVSVLATLFLLSYAKLLRTTLNAISSITIIDRYNTTHLRWLLDGNYGYLEWPHLALFLVGLLTLLTHLIPFTALVLLGPTLQAHTDYRLLRWVTRFKPFLDAYQGPYKTKYRYWTGLMLLVRLFLFAVFACNSLGDPNVNLLTISITLLVLLVAWLKIGRIYRLSLSNGLEVFYLTNLLITTITTLYLRATGDTNTQQQILFLIMVGSVAVVFIGTLIYHGYSELIKTNYGKKLKSKAHAIWNITRRRANNEEATTEQDGGEIQLQAKNTSPTRSVVCLNELKEPLLDS